MILHYEKPQNVVLMKLLIFCSIKYDYKPCFKKITAKYVSENRALVAVRVPSIDLSDSRVYN